MKKEKRVTITFAVILFISLSNLIIEILISVFGSLAVGRIDLSNSTNLLIHTITTIFMIMSIKFVRNNSIIGGILGVLIAILEIFFAGILWKLIGILLLADSIIYLVEYNKKNNDI